MNPLSTSDLWDLLKREYRLKTVLVVGWVWLLSWELALVVTSNDIMRWRSP